MRKLFFGLIILLSATHYTMAQAGSDAEASVLSYDPMDILQDFEDRLNSPSESNLFVEEFFTEFNVPQQGVNGLNLRETWYWWISNNATAVEEYIVRREENQHPPQE